MDRWAYEHWHWEDEGLVLPRVFDHAHGPVVAAASTETPLAGFGPAVVVGRAAGAQVALQPAAGARSFGLMATVRVR